MKVMADINEAQGLENVTFVDKSGSDAVEPSYYGDTLNMKGKLGN